jgi:cell division protein ZapA (FtsZ GTPase activity inhibitor)
MMNEKKSYKVHIFEEQYVLSSNEPEAIVLKAAEVVDLAMKEISHHFAITDTKKIAVLSALRIASMLLQYECEYSNREQRIAALKNYIDQELSLLNV